MKCAVLWGALAVLLAACGTQGAPPGPGSPSAPAPITPVVGAPAVSSSSPAPTVVAPATAPAGCPAGLASELADTHGAAQLVTVVAPSYAATAGTVTLWQRSGACWTVAGGPWSGRLGETGVSDHHREGDGSTPTGAYGIGAVMYGIAPDPGVRYRYHQLVCGDWWDEDPASATYNTFEHVACDTTPPFGGGSEALWKQTVAYQAFAVVDYNAHPPVPGAGSAVFLHDDVAGPTAGCISLPPAQLLTTLRLLDPAAHPLIVVGTAAEIRRF
ncbi:MAG TPA: L,D-transpeptidase family protein [Actinomycetota bacterium]|nr:L,D-transpeptidase family protein [Actinomycetota bacterium]